MRTEARVLAYIAVVGGLIMIAYGACVGDSKVTQAGGAVGVAGLALFGVAAGLTTWQQERQKAREEHQREAYTALVQQTYARFAGSYDSASEGKIRAQAAVWGNPEVVQKLAAWIDAYDAHVPAAATGLITLTDEGKQALKDAIGDLVVAVRRDLSPRDKVTSDEVVRALFNRSGR